MQNLQRGKADHLCGFSLFCFGYVAAYRWYEKKLVNIPSSGSVPSVFI